MNKTMVAEFDNLNYYEILEIPMSASSLEVRQAYEEAFSMYSEDSLVTYSLFGDKEREEILKRIEEAFATLIDREKRAEYDRNLVDIAGQNHKAGPVRDTGLKTSKNFPSNVTTAQGLLSHRVAQKAQQQDIVDLVESVLSREAISGEDLKRIRLSFEVELEEIHQVTKVSLPVLQAIEADQWADLPPEIYLRGFLKSYAKTLQIDAQKTVEGYMRHAR
ncbi:MAG: helix-turn-helix domain-containing protein [Desulfatiglans sp.]|jgi:DnaJ-class molecular chaperone|nr:helix-turn-helix domain-containing protein [Thermodesulfobacteriota bacterium]MEE4351472.1 helix-turn-helix domain-containing protein [Desulfatiglans sp.]